MDILGVNSARDIYSIQSISSGTGYAGSTSPGKKTSDTVSISPEAMSMFSTLKNKTPEERKIEDTMTSWFDQTKGGFTEYKSDYSKWSEGNIEQKKRYEAEIEAILAQEDDGKELSQKDLAKLDELRKKLNVLEALADKMNVDIDTMEYALNHLNKLETEWQKAHPEKSMLQTALDKWREIDPDKLEEQIKDKQESLLVDSGETEEDAAPEETTTSDNGANAEKSV